MTGDKKNAADNISLLNVISSNVISGHQVCSHIVNVFVGVYRQQIPMGLHRIVNIHLRDVTFPPEACATFRRPARS